MFKKLVLISNTSKLLTSCLNHLTSTDRIAERRCLESNDQNQKSNSGNVACFSWIFLQYFFFLTLCLIRKFHLNCDFSPIFSSYFFVQSSIVYFYERKDATEVSSNMQECKISSYLIIMASISETFLHLHTLSLCTFFPMHSIAFFCFLPSYFRDDSSTVFFQRIGSYAVVNFP